MTAMTKACQNLNADVVELLCEKEAGIIDKNGNTDLMIACEQKVYYEH